MHDCMTWTAQYVDFQTPLNLWTFKKQLFKVGPNKQIIHLEDKQTNNSGRRQKEAAFARAAADLDFGVAYIP